MSSAQPQSLADELRPQPGNKKTRPKSCLFEVSALRERIRLRLLLVALILDVFDDVADGLQFLGIFIRHFDGKFFFKSHH